MKRIDATLLNGSSLRGYIDADEDRVEELFGKPTLKNGEKTWCVEFENGMRAKVYYRQGNDELHIGGFDKNIVEKVVEAIEDGHEVCAETPEPTGKIILASRPGCPLKSGVRAQVKLDANKG